MLTEIPQSKKYAFSPLKTLQEKGIHKKIINIGGIGLMHDIGELMNDKQVVVIAATVDRCLLFVDLTDVECIDILNKAKTSYDARLRKGFDAEQENS